MLHIEKSKTRAAWDFSQCGGEINTVTAAHNFTTTVCTAAHGIIKNSHRTPAFFLSAIVSITYEREEIWTH